MFIDHRYEVLESLGSGAWANIYKVRDVRTNNLYTLKLFQYLSSDQFYANFKAADMHHITKIEHPNLNRVVDFGHVGDHVYCLSDYFAGVSLSNYRWSRNKITQLYDLLIQIAYALDALHTQNILHRDIKPENILYKVTGNTLQVKLIDYGLLRWELDKETQYVSGTLPYVAPEIYLSKDVGRSSDFYSLGVVLYRLLTGSYPYSLEQIQALRSGSQKYFIPIFPTELNPQIPKDLENLCLRLLERNPDNRFENSADFIAYINRSTGKNYPFSVSWSLVNTLQFNSYTVRDRQVNELLEYLPQVEQGNGKIISLLGGEGLGKGNILSLFRYQILRGAYFIFDYSCTRTEHEAFFALIKEYLQSLPSDDLARERETAQISDKMRQYLFGSEQTAKKLTQSTAELKMDYEYARALIVRLSRHKPLIFIIRDVQHVHHYTIDFLNFLSAEVVNNRILILLSSTDFQRIMQIKHTILVHVPMFELKESVTYIRKLLNAPVPEEFCELVHQRSCGNPFFIREILIDLTLHKLLTSGRGFHYPDNLDDYPLPGRIVHSIYSRMSHLSETSYKQLQKLSIVQTPISLDLIREICKLKDESLFDLLNESKFVELLDKRGSNYHFTFPEAQHRFIQECPPRLQRLVSLRVLKYFEGKQINDYDTLRGLVKNSELTGDLLSVRQQLLRLHHVLAEDYEQEQALTAISQVLLIDLKAETEIPEQDIRTDLLLCYDKLETAGVTASVSFLTEDAEMIPECQEKYLVLGEFHQLKDDAKTAAKLFQRAASLGQSPAAKVQARLQLARAYAATDTAKVAKVLQQVHVDDLSTEMRIEFVVQSAMLQNLNHDYDQAIRTIEDCLAELAPDQSPSCQIRLACLHNLLGEIFSHQKSIGEAEEHFNQAMNIWRRYNCLRWLALINNNLADLYLKQGMTATAIQHTQTGLSFSRQLDQESEQTRALLIQGEAMIKLGEFMEAEAILLEAKELAQRIHNPLQLDRIVRNLALAKSKIIGFGHYYMFLQQHEPRLIDGYVEEINPLVKTYFYYLSEMSHPRKLRQLIRKNAHIDYQAVHELEFYHNVQSLLALAEKKYDTALQELKLALQYAGEINNHYAIAVFNVLQAVCHYGMQDYARALDLVQQARPEISEYQYRYWGSYLDLIQIKLDLMNPSLPLRLILRRVNRLLEACTQHQYYQLIVELRQLKIQILLELNVEAAAQVEFDLHKAYLEQITDSVSPDERQNFLKVNLFNLTDLSKFRPYPLVSRRRDTRSKWNDLLYNIVNVTSVQRVKFLIEKGISQVLAPWQFKLMAYSDKVDNYYEFVCHNCAPDSYYPKEYKPHIDRAFDTDTLTGFRHEERNILIVPLQSGNKHIGFLILSDDGELPFTAGELALIRNIKNHLTGLIIRTWDYQEITVRMEKMRQLMDYSYELIRFLDLAELENALVAAAIDFTNATRGFLVKRDNEGNNLYQVQMDQEKQLLSSTAGISKTALALCQATLEPVITSNAEQDGSFKNSVSVHDYEISSIFCSPLLTDGSPHAYLYLDNRGDSTREMYLNQEVLQLFLNQVCVAVRNARTNETLMQRSAELNSLELLKDEFMAIVAHELNTPLSSLQGYLSRLKRNLYADEEERGEIVQKLENAVNRLTMSINDITTMNTYNVAKTLVKAPLQIGEIVNLVHQEVEIQSRKRHMQFKLEIEPDLPPLNANWEALHRMLYNIVINAVRFTNEFGSIVLGARKAVFPQERIANQDTLVLYVRDNGIGIPQYRLKDIFRKFFELNEIYAHKSGTIEYRSSGLGLGLAIARRIAELHGGTIAIKSKENEGTTVSVYIPFKQARGAD